MVWGVVTGLSVYVAWLNVREAPGARFEQWRSQRTLEEISAAITEHKDKHGNEPRTFNELLAEEKLQLVTGDYDDEKALDGWKRPFIFKYDARIAAAFWKIWYGNWRLQKTVKD